MKNDDNSIISILWAGCCSCLLKDVDPNDLEKALDKINTKGYCDADTGNINYRRLITKAYENEKVQLSDREIENTVFW